MNVEQNRLDTFSDWPADAAVSPARIAKAGFFSIKDQLTVECFACGRRISEWNYGDQVMARHRLLNPQCPFVLNPGTAGNIRTSVNVPSLPAGAPSAPSGSAGPSDTPDNMGVDRPAEEPSARFAEDLKVESNRLITFANWSAGSVVSAASLARAGFYSLKFEDKVKCAFCGGVVGFWEVGDDPDREHLRLFPLCPFVVSQIVPRVAKREPMLSNLNVVQRVENLEDLGLRPHVAPRHARYASKECRLATFAGWPEDLVQRPDHLADAGFYYVGGADMVRCFHCDGGLRHWDPHDDPWVEHGRWFPSCGYVQAVKGPSFVQSCALSSVSSSAATRAGSSPFTRVREVSDSDIQALMSTPAVLMALNVGLHVGRVKKALRYKLEQTGTGFSNAHALIDATFNMQLEESDEDDGEFDDSEITRQVSQMIREAVDRDEAAQRDEAAEFHAALPPTPYVGAIVGVPVAVPMASASNGEVPQVQAESPRAGNAAEDECSRAQTERSTLERPLSLEEENRMLKEARLCKICMDSEVGIVFLPCGHLATCVDCALSLQNCAVCRSPIKATVRTFLS